MGKRRIERDETPQRRRYRLNKKRFTGLLIALCCAAAALTGVMTLADPGKKASAGIDEENREVMGVAMQAQNSDALEGRLIVVDAGHGGFDPGATGVSGTREDVLNLAIAKRLKAEFEGCGARVIMTREDENAIADTKEEDMAERRQIIVQSGSDIVISIHMNFFDNDSGISGPLVMFMPGSEEGKQFAEAVQESMNTKLDASGVARSEELWIVESGSQPSVLVECGYLSNAEEEAKLCREDYQTEVAQAICAGTEKYFEKRDTKA